MARPAPSICSIATEAVQLPAGVRFEFVHDPLGWNLGIHNDVHVTRADVRGQQIPTAKRTVVPHGRQHSCSALLIELIWRLPHFLVLRQDSLRIWR
jgi:hypothetical protein